MKDSWQSGDPYEYYMGRWSKLVAEEFVDWLETRSGLRWLDVGCGSGALSEAILEHCEPQSVTAIDQSEGFVLTAQQRLGSKAECKVDNALSLAFDDNLMDVTVSGLVINFIPEREKALEEMRRVTSSGGTVAVYIWDYAGVMEFLNHFWDVVVELHPDALNLHEGRRFAQANAEALNDMFRRAGFLKVETAPLDIVTKFADFEDYWLPFLGGQGPAPTYVSKLKESDRSELRDALLNRLPIARDGSISLAARAWAARGLV